MSAFGVPNTGAMIGELERGLPALRREHDGLSSQRKQKQKEMDQLDKEITDNSKDPGLARKVDKLREVRRALDAELKVFDQMILDIEQRVEKDRKLIADLKRQEGVC